MAKGQAYHAQAELVRVASEYLHPADKYDDEHVSEAWNSLLDLSKKPVLTAQQYRHVLALCIGFYASGKRTGRGERRC